jgi:hypothetical protein
MLEAAVAAAAAAGVVCPLASTSGLLLKLLASTSGLLLKLPASTSGLLPKLLASTSGLLLKLLARAAMDLAACSCLWVIYTHAVYLRDGFPDHKSVGWLVGWLVGFQAAFGGDLRSDNSHIPDFDFAASNATFDKEAVWEEFVSCFPSPARQRVLGYVCWATCAGLRVRGYVCWATCISTLCHTRTRACTSTHTHNPQSTIQTHTLFPAHLQTF